MQGIVAAQWEAESGERRNQPSAHPFCQQDGAVVRLVKWTSPLELRAFVELIMQTARLLNVPLALGEGGQQDASARVRTDLPRHFDSLRSLRGTRHHARAHADA
jgi:hypothetical protein